MVMRLFYLCLSMVLFLVACSGTPSAPSTPTPEPAPATGSQNTSTSAPGPVPGSVTGAGDPGLNLLVLADGSVTLKRRQWSDYFSIVFGSELHRGDLIRVNGGGNALVLCDGLTIWEVPGGAPAGLNNGCPPPPEAVLIRGDSLVGNTRGGSDPLIPYVISPRKTSLLSATPILRWNPVPGATSYRVRLRGSDVDWSITTDSTAIEYPGNPALLAGATYALVVDADNGTSSRDEGVAGLGFTIMDEVSAQKIRDGIERIEALNLSDQAQTLAVTQFMLGNGLFAEAMASLKDLPETDAPLPAVAKTLADIYRQLSLNLLAADQYESALEVIGADGDVELDAEIKASLAQVYLSLGNREEAKKMLTDAIATFETLGDTQRVADISASRSALGE